MNIIMRANTGDRKVASTRAKNRNGHRKTNKVNEFGLKYSDISKAEKSKIDVLLLKPVSGLGELGDTVAVSIPQWENSLRRSKSARLLKPHELQNSAAPEPSAEHWARRPISSRPAVSVYDGVYTSASQTALWSAAESSGVYVRANGAATAAEHAIESLLRELGDAETAEVEYWGRESWAAMEAHRDADEDAASTDGSLRLPSRVMLLYGDVAEGLAAPTVLWCEPQAKKVLAGDDGGVDGGVGGAGRLVLVPAISGRVLDFDGGLMHAVPWCLGAGGDDDAACAVGEDTRMVMVLNCWSDYAPKGGEEDDDEEEEGEPEEEAAAGMDKVDGATTCEPKRKWSRATIQPGADIVDAAAEWSFALDTFGCDEPLVTRVLCSGDDAESAFFAAVREPSHPQWLKTVSHTPPIGVGVPSVEGAREERM